MKDLEYKERLKEAALEAIKEASKNGASREEIERMKVLTSAVSDFGKVTDDSKHKKADRILAICEGSAYLLGIVSAALIEVQGPRLSGNFSFRTLLQSLRPKK